MMRRPRFQMRGFMPGGKPGREPSSDVMPEYGLSGQEAQAVTVFVLSLKGRKTGHISFTCMPKIVNYREFSQY